MAFRVLTGDNRKLLKKLAANSVESCVCDPPYELGFMGKTWDKTGIANSVELWREVLRVLKPGGMLLAFGGTRTYHRMVCAIEDAGFEIRDQIGWLYGSGFPKSLDVSKAIDKNNGKSLISLEPFGAYIKERRKAKMLSLVQLDTIMGTNTAASWWEGRARGVQLPSLAAYRKLKIVLELDARFDGLIEWAEAEREVVGKRKVPIGHSFAGDVYGNGNGSKEFCDTKPSTPAAKKWQGWGTALKPAWEPIVLARKPLTQRTVAENVQRFGTGAINVDACRVGTNGSRPLRSSENGKRVGTLYKGGFGGSAAIGETNRGRWPANVIHDGSDKVLAEFPNGRSSFGGGNRKNGESVFVGMGKDGGLSQQYFDTGTAARFFYCAKASKRDRECGGALPVKNNHPTVKPTALMRYLCKLVTPKGGTVLDPFTGSGSTGKAAVLEGFSFIGCELSKEYSAIAKARISAAI